MRRGTIGVVLDRVNEAASETAQTKTLEGALVVSVAPESSAELVGLQANDIITSFNGRDVKTPQGLRAAIGVARSNVPLGLTYVRAGVSSDTQVSVIPHKPPVVAGLEQVGALVRPIQEADDLPAELKGVYVRRVIDGSPAAGSGLLVGDVIVGVNNELADTPQVCDRLVSETHGRVQLVVYRFGTLLPIMIS